MKVFLLFKGNFRANEEDKKRESQQEKTAKAIEKVLRERGFETERLYLSSLDLSSLSRIGHSPVFNLYAATGQEQALVTSLLEYMGIPYTGSDPLGHFLALAKHVAKSIWMRMGIPVPKPFLPPWPSPEDFPLIVKPAFGGSGEGVETSSIVYNEKELISHLERKKSFSPLLVEEFIDGQELTVGILGNPPHVLPPLEVCFDRLPLDEAKINSFLAKTKYSDLVQIKKAELSPPLEEGLKEGALQAFTSLGLRDYARVDIRLEGGSPHILEINSLPGLEPGYSDLPRAAELEGLSYSDLIMKIMEMGISRIR